MWKIEQEDQYFKIYDEKKTLVGYFAPEYGDIQPEERVHQIIDEMIKNHDLIQSGYLMVPMVKFGLFEEGKEMTVDYVEQQLRESYSRILAWRNVLTEKEIPGHKIMISHTDHDMLSITLGVEFPNPTPLDKNQILQNLTQFLDFAHLKNLL